MSITENNSNGMEDLTASRITILVPAGTSPEKAEQFALSHNGKVVFCKGKELDQVVEEEKPGWFSWINPWNWWSKKDISKGPKEETDTESKEIEQETNNSNDNQIDSNSSNNENIDFSEELTPKLMTGEDLFVLNWKKNFGISKEEAIEVWKEMTAEEMNFFIIFFSILHNS